MYYNLKVKEYKNNTTQVKYFKKGIYFEKDTYSQLGFEVKKKKRQNNTIKIESPFIDDDKKILKLTVVNNFNDVAKKQEHSIQSSMNRTINALYDISRSNEWEYFFTFTFNDNVVNRKDFTSCSRLIRKWLNNFRSRHSLDLQYLIVPEQHKDGNWHFHGLLSNLGNAKLSVAINNQEYYKGKKNKYYGQELRTKYPNGDFIYNLDNYKYGYTTATKVKDTKRVSSYIIKYITKDLCSLTKNQRRYYKSNNIDKPAVYKFLVDKESFKRYQAYFREESVYKKAVHVEYEAYENDIFVYEFVDDDIGKKIVKEYDDYWRKKNEI